MSQRRVNQSHGLPQHPAWLSVKDFPKSDGTDSQYPTALSEASVDESGSVNYYVPAQNDDSICIRWRKELGDALAKHRRLPANKPYVLSTLPKGYKIFVQNKGQPGAKIRQDIYLYGSKTVLKFRSIPEFIPHFLWLADVNKETCECKYCVRTSHRPRASTSRIAPAQPVIPPKEPRPLEQAGIFTAISYTRADDSGPQSLPSSRRTDDFVATMLPDRARDLDAVSNPKEGRMQRLFRKNELVWVVLEQPIMGPEGENIATWLGIVTDARTKTAPPHRNHGTTTLDVPSLTSSSTQAESSLHATNAPTWTAQQQFVYRIRFLCVCAEHSVDADHVIPFQAHRVSDTLRDALFAIQLHQPANIAVASTDFDFDPWASDAQWVDAVQPFLFAWEMGTRISHCWNLTDSWEKKISTTMIADTPVASTSTGVGMDSIANAYNAAALANNSYDSISARRNQRNIGNKTEVNFQGIWWGAERIWAGDLVRLMLPRSSLAPQGSADILPCAEPGPSSRQQLEQLGKKPSLYTSGIRGLFMLIDRIFLVERKADNNSRKQEARVAGQLYELVDEDWVDPEPRPFVQQGSHGLSAPPRPKRLPPAPVGYKFHAILRPQREMVFSVILLGGRYYPRILTHQYLHPIVRTEEGKLNLNANFLCALEGLSAGTFNYVEPIEYKKDREEIVSYANMKAIENVRAYKESRLRHEANTAMDTEVASDEEVDELAMDID
ncbi:hypothetical protein CYLTODRAFT_442498 [Cylindrobasidium torrendii FP15055 ss-10]|uniref:Cryptic loci regulator 2 N-terminal domain-containing protein n=1 Tax=Cylindrobasidium torrendii FP15055 ss-10 TaxID=1314674 RepID=A0A0D7BHQ0_9AGAR|nr:hypothetical protein CYLTODRAFT_442498 [Cylindrobasidium torrendii FP15055 ss-10]